MIAQIGKADGAWATTLTTFREGVMQTQARTRGALALALSCLLGGLPLHAQGGAGTIPELTVVSGSSKTPHPVSLRLPASSVAQALGNIGIVSRDADVLYYNPGMLTQAAGVAASAQRIGSATTAGAVASVQQLGGYAVGVGARFVDWSSPSDDYGIALSGGTGVFGMSGSTRASSLALTGGVARTLGPVRVGVTATYLREQFAELTDETALLDVGAAVTLGPGMLGFSLQQLGGPVTFANTETDEPWRVTLGYGTRTFPIATFVDIAGVWQASVDTDGEIRPAGGMEVFYVPIEGLSFVARAGARRPLDAGESVVTAGLGVSLDRVSLDYALDPSREGPVAHRIGIRIR